MQYLQPWCQASPLLIPTWASLLWQLWRQSQVHQVFLLIWNLLFLLLLFYVVRSQTVWLNFLKETFVTKEMLALSWNPLLDILFKEMDGSGRCISGWREAFFNSRDGNGNCFLLILYSRREKLSWLSREFPGTRIPVTLCFYCSLSA